MPVSTVFEQLTHSTWDPTLIGERNETSFIRVWKPLFSGRVLKLGGWLRYVMGKKWTIFASGGFELLHSKSSSGREQEFLKFVLNYRSTRKLKPMDYDEFDYINTYVLWSETFPKISSRWLSNSLHVYSGNLLLTEDKQRIKLADFGLAREEISGKMTTEAGTYRWMAPEVTFSFYSVWRSSSL